MKKAKVAKNETILLKISIQEMECHIQKK